MFHLNTQAIIDLAVSGSNLTHKKIKHNIYTVSQKKVSQNVFRHIFYKTWPILINLVHSVLNKLNNANVFHRI